MQTSKLVWQNLFSSWCCIFTTSSGSDAMLQCWVIGCETREENKSFSCVNTIPSRQKMFRLLIYIALSISLFVVHFDHSTQGWSISLFYMFLQDFDSKIKKNETKTITSWYYVNFLHFGINKLVTRGKTAKRLIWPAKGCAVCSTCLRAKIYNNCNGNFCC